MALELEGRVKYIGPIMTGQSSRGGEWKKRTFVISTLEQFPRDVAFVTWNERAEALDNLKVGQRVRVQFSLESRQFEDRWYTDAKAWNIKVIKEEDVISITGGGSGGGQTTQTGSGFDQDPFAGEPDPFAQESSSVESDISDNSVADDIDTDQSLDTDFDQQDLLDADQEDDLPF